MPICSYLVLTASGAADALATKLAVLPGCEIFPAENRDLLILVTDTPGPAEDEELRLSLLELNGIEALLLTFGELEPGAGSRMADRRRDCDPARGSAAVRPLPVLPTGVDPRRPGASFTPTSAER